MIRDFLRVGDNGQYSPPRNRTQKKRGLGIAQGKIFGSRLLSIET
jgi:hypothetical protein